MRQLRKNQGQSLIEFALILPLIFLLIVNVVNFGAYLYAGITVSNAARAGADYMMMGPATAGGPSLPTSQDITDLIKGYTATGAKCKDNTDPQGTHCPGDLGSLPNRSTAIVTVCTNNNGHQQVPPGDGSCLATADPQASTSVVGEVSVEYTYSPVIPFWDFSALRIHLTIPRTQMKRTATTRLIQ